MTRVVFRPAQYAFWVVGCLAALIVMLPSCKKTDPPVKNLNIRFSPVWNGSPITLNTNNTGPDNRRFRFSKMKMYLSHIRFVAADGTETEVRDIAFLNLANPSTLQLSLNGLSGTYTGMKFGLGLDSAQSTIDPTTVGADSPLNPDNGMWWSNVEQYVFAEVEGQCDTIVPMPAGVIWNFLYHPGTQACYRTVTITQTFNFSGDGKNEVTVAADFQKIFYANNAIQITSEPTTSTTDKPALAVKFANQMQQIFSVL
ncbi:MAG: MbnP family protein [Chitinophagales bacterium]